MSAVLFLHKTTKFFTDHFLNSLQFITVVSYVHHRWLYSIAIKSSGNIEEYPRPKPISCDSLCICHWNLNSIPAHNLAKLSSLPGYISINKFDIICLPKVYSDSSVSYLGIILYVQIIQIILKAVEFAFIIIIIYL